MKKLAFSLFALTLMSASLLIGNFARATTLDEGDGPANGGTLNVCHFVKNCLLTNNIGIRVDLHDEATKKFTFILTSDYYAVTSTYPEQRYYKKYDGSDLFGPYHLIALDTAYVDSHGGLAGLISTFNTEGKLYGYDAFPHQGAIFGHPENTAEFRQHEYALYTPGVIEAAQDEKRLYPFGTFNSRQDYEIEDNPKYHTDKFYLIGTFPVYAFLGVGYTEDGKKKMVLYRKNEYVYGGNGQYDPDAWNADALLNSRQFNPPQIDGLVQNPSNLMPFTPSTTQGTTAPTAVSESQSIWAKIWNFFARIFR